MCPGSRSTPLALALRTAPGLRVRVLYDERAAGVLRAGHGADVAAGRWCCSRRRGRRWSSSRRPSWRRSSRGCRWWCSRPTGRPSSGTAARPRPIDQDAPLRARGEVVHGAAAARRGGRPRWRTGAGSRVAPWPSAAAGPAGPVQVNVPFREPLLPDGPLAHDAGARGPARRRSRTSSRAARSLDDARLDDARRAAGRGPRGASSSPDRTTTRGCPRRSRALASGRPASRSSPTRSRASAPGRTTASMVVARADQLVRPGAWIDAHRAGPRHPHRAPCPPPSRSSSCSSAPARSCSCSTATRGWREAALLPATFVHADAAATVAALAARLALGRPARGRGVGRATGSTPSGPRSEAMDAWLAALDEPFEGAPVAGARRRAPGRRRPLGRRAPCRSATWTPGSRRRTARSPSAPTAARTASTASSRPRSGSAAVADGPVALVVGDIAFLHDLNALVAARLHGLSATIVLVNNDGGGIFSFLPQAQPGVRRARLRPPGALRGAVRDAARDRRRADRDGARRGAPARDRRSGPGRGDPRLRSAGRASASWSCGRTGHGTSSCTGTWRRSSPGRSPGWCR